MWKSKGVQDHQMIREVGKAFNSHSFGFYSPSRFKQAAVTQRLHSCHPFLYMLMSRAQRGSYLLGLTSSVVKAAS